MPDRREFASHSVTIDTPATGGAVVLGGITSLSDTLNTETTNDESGGRYDTLRAINSQMPVFEATTKSALAALLAMSVEGDCFHATGTQTGVTATWEHKPVCAADSTDVGANTHLSHSARIGVIKPNQLTAARGQDATLSFMVDALTDGTNAPIGINDGATLPSPLDVSQFQVGAMRVGGVLFEYTRSMDLSFGVELGEKTPDLGEVWPDSVSIDKVRPEASFTGKQANRIAAANAAETISLLGREGTHVDTVIWFRKRANRGTFVDNATAEHFTLTLSGLIVPESVSSSNASTADVAFKMYGVSDGATPIILTPNVPYNPTP